MIKYITLAAVLLASACSQPSTYISECEKWPLRGHCDNTYTHPTKEVVGPVDPSPEPPEVDEPSEEPEEDEGKGNNGHGNGDEGDCQGAGCDDPTNPGKGKK